jgi:hypothetical protein
MSLAGAPNGYGDYVIFVDESGDHGLQSIDPTYPVFVLAFCVLSKGAYARQVIPAVTEFKFRHFGHDQVVLHERDMRKGVCDRFVGSGVTPRSSGGGADARFLPSARWLLGSAG